MGRSSEDEGETSTQTCKSDDIDDRPLKKARYVWQIKGKYHLKKPDEDKSSLFVSKSNISDDCTTVAISHCSQIECQNSSCKCEVKVIETHEDCVKEIDEHLSEDRRTLLNAQDNTPIADTTKTVSSESEDELLGAPISTKVSRSVVSKRPALAAKVLRCGRVSSSWQLRKWQARQVARCFVDNTINRVLEDMGFVPLPVDTDDILGEEFTMTESEHGEGLEDEAVLMAIHSHGLQRTDGVIAGPDVESVTTNDKNTDSTQVSSCNSDKGIAMPACACSVAQRVSSTDVIESLDPFHQRPVMWHRLEFDTERCHGLDSVSHQSEEELKRNGNLMSRWCGEGGIFGPILTSDSSSCDSDIISCEENMKENGRQDHPVLATESDMLAVSSESEIHKVIIQDHKDITQQTEIVANDKQLGDKVEDKSSSSFEHSDFLDKAVAVAIQKKGLSALSCADFGSVT